MVYIDFSSVGFFLWNIFIYENINFVLLFYDN